MSDAVIEVIDRYPVGHQFHGNELKDDVVRIYPESQHQYVDTILRMARRHRRGAFRVVDRNNSLYEKMPYKSFIEQIREAAPKEKQPERKPGQATQGLLFAHFFLVGFFALLFCVPLESGFGRPLFPASRIASRSAFVYIPAEPMYLKGSIPFRLSLILTAAVEMPSVWAISKTVIPSIPRSISANNPSNQVEIAKMLQHYHILLHKRIAKNVKKIQKFASGTLTVPLAGCILLLCYSIVTNKKRLPGTPVAERLPIGAKGEFDERMRKPSGMA
jgi:hypothetical protein